MAADAKIAALYSLPTDSLPELCDKTSCVFFVEYLSKFYNFVSKEPTGHPWITKSELDSMELAINILLSKEPSKKSSGILSMDVHCSWQKVLGVRWELWLGTWLLWIFIVLIQWANATPTHTNTLILQMQPTTRFFILGQVLKIKQTSWCQLSIIFTLKRKRWRAVTETPKVETVSCSVYYIDSTKIHFRYLQ